MLIHGNIITNEDEYEAYLYYGDAYIELILGIKGVVVTAFKLTDRDELCYSDKKAKEIYTVIKAGINGCKAKNCNTVPFKKGICSEYRYTKSKLSYVVSLYRNKLCGIYVEGNGLIIDLVYESDENLIPNIQYTKMTSPNKNDWNFKTGKREPIIRTLDEIVINSGKDISWLSKKRYHIVDDVETAEKIFNFLETYDGPIAFDTETTGLQVNMFGKVGAKEVKTLEEYNLTLDEDERIKNSKLVGIVFCWKKDESYYFPCGQKFFKNLYEDKEDERVKCIIKHIRENNINRKNKDSCTGKYIENTSDEELSCDIILMERVRKILETRHLVGHNITFDWKVAFLYDVVANFKDDVMILHQLLYRNKDIANGLDGSSRLKSLTKKEFNIDQLDLEDFFVQASTSSKSSKKEIKRIQREKDIGIDFSFMNYEGARSYVPADGDFTFSIFTKYKKDLLTNFREMEEIYSIEIYTACAIAYMEFCGHRIEESKIEQAKDDTIREISQLETEIRKIAGIGDEEKVNLGSSKQVFDLFFNRLQIPYSGIIRSVKHNVIKQYTELKNEDGSIKYPIINLYARWKSLSTLLTKFFDQLQHFMYPGGFIFSSYWQIETGTGRMSCSNPNAQQYPKEVTALVAPRENALLLDVDYSQIEYRILVGLAKEENLLGLFNDPDNDYHTLMASIMYDIAYELVTKDLRDEAKAFNFGIPYGMGFASLAIRLKGENNAANREYAMEKYELYFKNQPKVRVFFDNIKEAAEFNKYTTTHFGRRRYYKFTDADGKYSKKSKASAMRQAGNAVIQGTAADIFKISMARMYLYIKSNYLFHKIFITNMIHDECLYEVDISKVNLDRVIKDIYNVMHFKIDGFPPFYIGAGLGKTWKSAKGKYAEIHPQLYAEINEKYKDYTLEPVDTTVDELLTRYGSINEEFRVRKITNYLNDENNHNKVLSPTIGSMLNSYFRMGVDYPVGGSDDTIETKMEILSRFINNYGISSKVTDFKFTGDSIKDDDQDNEYEDEENDEDSDYEYGSSEFALLDESDQIFGTSIIDIIDIYGLLISHKYNICGIDARGISKLEIEKISAYLDKFITDEDDIDGLEVVILGESNVLKRTGILVKNVKASEIATIIKYYKVAS